MKKIILLITCVLMVCACSSNDDNDDNKSSMDTRLVGTWEKEDGTDVLTFNSNGTIVEEETYSPSGESETLDIPLDERIESITFYHWEGEWTTTDDSKIHLHWKKGRYMRNEKDATWKDLEDAEDFVIFNYTISSDGKTFIVGDIEGEQHRKPIYYYKK